MRKITFFTYDHHGKIGGMETHAASFETYFSDMGMIRYIICKSVQKVYTADDQLVFAYKTEKELFSFLKKDTDDVFFFNDGHWIEEYVRMKMEYKKAQMVMRSGGNEFVKAPLGNMNIPLEIRQKIWAHEINHGLDFIIANSSYSVNRLLEIGVSKSKIILIRGGVDGLQCLANRKDCEKNRAAFDTGYGTKGKVLFCISSRLERFKGIMETLETLKSIQSLNWHLVIMGIGSQEWEIKQYLYEHFEDDKYTFLGGVDHRTSMRIISISDYLLNFSIEQIRKSGRDEYIHTETMGRSMIEAICQNIPVLASKAGGTEELFLENPGMGVLTSNSRGMKEVLADAVSDVKKITCVNAGKYDWNYIFTELYLPLFHLESMMTEKMIAAVDVDGTITQESFDSYENAELIESVLKLFHDCCVILNTAGDYESLLENYPVINTYKNKIVIIANCGKRLFLYGNECMFWKNYGESILGPTEITLGNVKEILRKNKVIIYETKIIDKLYYNFKVNSISDELIDQLNQALVRTAFSVCRNNQNLKLISKEINKGNTLDFVAHSILKADYIIGAGNNVLDESFLQLCDKAYFVNAGETKEAYEKITIKNIDEAKKFIEKIRDDIYEKAKGSAGHR